MANRRIRRKKRKQSVIIYDQNATPQNMTVYEVLDKLRKTGVLLYSSRNGCNKPAIWPKKNTKYFNIIEIHEPFRRIRKIMEELWGNELLEKKSESAKGIFIAHK
jgi:hypothetical protein